MPESTINLSFKTKMTLVFTGMILLLITKLLLLNPILQPKSTGIPVALNITKRIENMGSYGKLLLPQHQMLIIINFLFIGWPCVAQSSQI